jgi:Trypsin-co-occurring domain 1
LEDGGTIVVKVNEPEEIEMEFGFSLSAGAGVIIASASTEANYRVTLRWKGEAQESSG